MITSPTFLNPPYQSLASLLAFKLPFFQQEQRKSRWSSLYDEQNRENVAIYLAEREATRRFHSPRTVLNYHGYEQNLGPNSVGPQTIAYRSLVAARVPAMLKEREISMEPYDKIFSACWISPHKVLLGTKCNKLLAFDIHNFERCEIPLISSPIQGDLTQPRPSETPQLNRESIFEQMIESTRPKGIRSIVVNPSKTLLAMSLGGQDAIGIYRLPDFEQVAYLKGHIDLIFGLAWLDDMTLVSGSRDHSVALWKLPLNDSDELDSQLEEEQGYSSQSELHSPVRQEQQPQRQQLLQLAPITLRQEHEGKVRDLKYNPCTKQLVTLSSDATIKIWEMDRFHVTSTLSLVHSNETVCMSVDEQTNLYAIGSQSHVTLFDPRTHHGMVHDIDSLDGASGVRSLAWSHHVLSIGGGMGRISFYDLRNQSYLNLTSSPPQQVHSDEKDVEFEYGLDHLDRRQKGRLYHEAGNGWLLRDNLYYTHFHGENVPNAVYALAYNPAHTHLLAAGGPLQLGLRGSYLGLWA